jgi:hypothetical protein
VGPRYGLEGCRKSRPPPGFDPWTVQPEASRLLKTCPVGAVRQNCTKATVQGGGLLQYLPEQFFFRWRWLQNHNVHDAYK